MKADELRLEVRELEADVKRLINKFINRNGLCNFKIDVEAGRTETEDGTSIIPTVTVDISISI